MFVNSPCIKPLVCTDLFPFDILSRVTAGILDSKFSGFVSVSNTMGTVLSSVFVCS